MPFYQCSEWSICEKGNQTRSCNQTNVCDTGSITPDLSRKCVSFDVVDHGSDIALGHALQSELTA